MRLKIIEEDVGNAKRTYNLINLDMKRARLLCDFRPHGRIVDLVGIFGDEDGFSERLNIIIDGEGKIVFFKKHNIPELPYGQEIINSLKI